MIRLGSDEINLEVVEFADVNCITSGRKLNENNIFNHSGDTVRIVSEHGVFQSRVGNVKFFLSLEKSFALNVKSVTAVDDESFF